MEKHPQERENKIILSIPNSNPEELPTFVNNLLQKVMQERGMQLDNNLKMQAENNTKNRLVFSPQVRPKTPSIGHPKNEKDLMKALQKELKKVQKPTLIPRRTIQLELAQENIKKKKQKITFVLKRLPQERLQIEWKNAPTLKPDGY